MYAPPECTAVCLSHREGAKLRTFCFSHATATCLRPIFLYAGARADTHIFIFKSLSYGACVARRTPYVRLVTMIEKRDLRCESQFLLIKSSRFKEKRMLGLREI
eukprot:7383946-Prymnesium_polylepis.1